MTWFKLGFDPCEGWSISGLLLFLEYTKPFRVPQSSLSTESFTLVLSLSVTMYTPRKKHFGHFLKKKVRLSSPGFSPAWSKGCSVHCKCHRRHSPPSSARESKSLSNLPLLLITLALHQWAKEQTQCTTGNLEMTHNVQVNSFFSLDVFVVMIF